MTRQLRDRPRRQRLPCSNLCDAAGRKSPDDHAQTARNLRCTLRTAAGGARLIQADGLDSKSAADASACLADALDELHRLKRSWIDVLDAGPLKRRRFHTSLQRSIPSSLLTPGTRPSSRRRDQDVLVQVFFYEVNEF
jgi:hypothetical protein